MKRLSRVALVVAAAALVVPISGCAALLSPQQTAQYQYNAGDGAWAEFGEVTVANILLVGTGEGEANLFYAIVNNSEEPAQVEIQVGETTVTESVPAGGELAQNPHTPISDDDRVIVSGYEARPGLLADVEVTVNGDTQTVRAQIVSDALPDYAPLVPTQPATEGGAGEGPTEPAPTEPAPTETAGAEEAAAG